MSKKVTATHDSIYCDGLNIVMGSDGNVYQGDECRKGDVIVGAEDCDDWAVALNKKGIKACLKAMALLKQAQPLRDSFNRQMRELERKLETIDTKDCTDYAEGVVFNFDLECDENGGDDLTISIGCTEFSLDEVEDLVKQLKLS